MADFLQRLKQRKLVQWAVAYVAFAFALIQVLDVVADSYHWPDHAMHIVFGLLVLGFIVTLVLAWYHGEQGRQRASSTELLLIALVLAVGGGLLWHFGRPDSAVAPTGSVSSRTLSAAVVASPIMAQPIPAKSIAVLPFENLSTDKGNAYFADGMQDLILTKLADIGDLKVIARTSTESYGSHPENLSTVGQQLGVATILEGSVQKAGNQVLINVQLINASTDSHIWAQSYQRTLSNIFGVEGEVAQKVADALKAKLTVAETARLNTIPTKSPQAYELFLKGEYALNSYSLDGYHVSALDTATRDYESATQQDPEFALAYARLAQAEVFQFLRARGEGRQKYASQAKTAVGRALKLAPSLAAAYVAQGLYQGNVVRDDIAAFRAYKEAVALQPQNAVAVGWADILKSAHAANTNETTQRVEAYIKAGQHVRNLDPRSADNLLTLSFQYIRLRRYEKAEQLLEQVLAIDPASESAITMLANLRLLQGRPERALALLEAAPSVVQNDPSVVVQRTQILQVSREYAAARKLAATLKPGNGISAERIEIDRGDIAWALDQKAQARADYLRAVPLLEKAIKADPRSVNLRGDLAWSYVRLGRTGAAITEAQSGIKLFPESRNSFRGTLALFRLATIQAELGHATDAVATLNLVLASPSGDYISVPLLKINPIWDPIRKDPRFQALLKKYANAAPAPASSGDAHG